ncbi:hypothetical protein BO94DRAFT_536984 [Aspergillus sclerotioniger CBS 115572]|uniref:CENP-V/GFA domain-containing protein n=1 Tax=Aspergillus sclerotioniger CBS 115572 TaxID=1450535 RepID=A0A317W2Q9_9EURO|nr:hypothetical protein BO94DRAFT_536984 [Aspergillus sclerotioniger CBS 115572]PWY80763.1 hypothetical protein BO94DRAFT_536984 [Aspergillus sclerotioniger CBS 115572]
MSYSGHCNCGNISITLAQQPEKSVICHCSTCRRGGSGAFSINYFVDESDLKVEDPNGVLKVYNDHNTASGNIVQRHFCSNCASPVYGLSPRAPGKAFVKAGLFDSVSRPGMAVFGEQQQEWVTVDMA